MWPLCLHSGITFILDRFEGWNSVIRVQTRLSLDKALSQVADHTQPSSHVSLQGRKGEKALWGPFYKGSCLYSQNSECGKMWKCSSYDLSVGFGNCVILPDMVRDVWGYVWGGEL